MPPKMTSWLSPGGNTENVNRDGMKQVLTDIGAVEITRLWDMILGMDMNLFPYEGFEVENV